MHHSMSDMPLSMVAIVTINRVLVLRRLETHF